ncbi:MAG TPA: prepilin-type N-terminal cleavage/methylation domain-containing protein [Candidatus Omnitrophota bacterium]|nr:prepilin-type N-terminal cleavage/methylation domain-containing protein [Candidatus Omnitrophota bacterium]HQJ15809.1 prepilin-type N-terminal cleavage/methylation domain-containing protein [Candidatus Omnitrophota bacterium]
MKKAFTLIELMIVVIIVGVLAVVAVIQYFIAVERARAAEARDILGNLRKGCAVIYDRDRSVLKCTPKALNIGMEEGMIPSECCRSHYFNYSAEESPSFEDVMVFTATRCMKYGRPPDAKQPGSITLTVDYLNNTQVLSSQGIY